MNVLPLLPIVGHSWGWDEILMFAVPIVLALGGIRWAEKRAAQRYEETHGTEAENEAETDAPN